VNSDVTGSGSNNLILNCDSYQNSDTQTNGESADYFGAKENPGGGNVFQLPGHPGSLAHSVG